MRTQCEELGARLAEAQNGSAEAQRLRDLLGMARILVFRHGAAH